ncbi:MAG: acyl-ACP--UDP-N-acetylglucosamine O-acyltransferase [Rubrimonas sp.]|uniref:acyl-ACP--UDP-N-acetylglucosamine O-acyltransferase n=1 Tax=Rubrimonas sp. TaxID=2036015 RepID=UPI002FDE2005
MSVHPTAIVAEGARIDPTAEIGPYCVIGPEVVLGAGVVLHSHVAVAGDTEIGARTRIWPFASIGHQPQDLKFRGEKTRLTVGADCMIREGATLNPGTEGGGGLTSVGDRCLLMVGVHVGHDCRVGSDVIMANNATLGGHVEVGDGAVLGGICAVHQKVRIGRFAMVGGMTGVEKDVIPYGSVIGDRARLAGLNIVGLKRRGVAHSEIHAIRAAYRDIFEGEGALAERAAVALEAYADAPRAREIAAFIAEHSARAFCTPARD